LEEDMPEEAAIDMTELTEGINQELDFAQRVFDDVSTKNRDLKQTPDLKAKMDDWLDSSSSVTLKRDEKGAIECDTCKGDPSDMVYPFWRHSKKTDGMKVKSFTVPAKTRFWNAKETTQCMKDKYILLLGDSTIVENLNDMVLLLAGGPKKVNPGQFYQDVTHVPHSGVLKYDTLEGEMVNTYTGRNRNQTVSLNGLNLHMKYRFTGAAKLAGNCGGLEVLLQDTVRQEIDSLVKNGGRKPDAIIIHSAMHDMCNAQLHKNHLKSFYGSIDKVGEEFIKPWVEQGIKVIWRGSYRFPAESQSIENPALGDYRVPAKLDLLAKETVEKHGGTYVDIADLLGNVHDESGCCSSIGSATTTFPHLGAVSVYHTPKAATFLSQLVSYKLLDAICPVL